MLWIDLETTGTRPSDQIIEVGMLITDPDYRIISQYQATYKTTVPIGEIAPEVLEMHYRNGLWLGVYQAENFASDGKAQNKIMQWLGDHYMFSDGRIPVAGSGISHFDRRFIDKYWEALAPRLTYYNYDIGVVRRFLREWGMISEKTTSEAQSDKTHRALDDIKEHLDEARTYRARLSYDWGIERPVTPREPKHLAGHPNARCLDCSGPLDANDEHVNEQDHDRWLAAETAMRYDDDNQEPSRCYTKP